MRKFIDDEHLENYNLYLEKSNVTDDLYRKSLFYILSSLNRFRRNITLIYDFKKNDIKKEVLEEIPLSDSEVGLLELAFHLYNDKNKFNLDTAFSNFEPQRQLIALNGIQIRYNGNLLYNDI